MTTLIGPLKCKGCHRPVSVVHRPVLIWGHGTGSRCCLTRKAPYCTASPSAVLTEVAVLGSAGEPHQCDGGRVA